MTDFTRSTRIRLAIGASAGALLLGAQPAAAQATDPATQPTANPTAPAAIEATDASTQPTPAPDNTAATATPSPDETAPAEPESDIVVTGFRAALASSANIKRNATVIVDSVSAEDIGKLPDVSIADSLARIPGVTAQRLEGRDQRLSIRGLGPDFSTTLLNGREQVTVGDNRGVEYDQYPSEFFKNVNVYKSADASLIAAGIAGTVDLRMLRPLDQKKRTFVVAARGQMNEQNKLNPDGTRYGYRASATYVDRFANDTFGIAIGVSAQQTPTQIERYAAWGFPNESAAGGNLFLGGAKPYVQSNNLKRYGGVATLEWEPSDNFHSTFDALYSHFEETQLLRGIEFPIAPQWGSNAVIAPGYTVENGLVTKATLSNVVAVQRNDYNKRTAENLSLGWNNDFRISDSVHFIVDASWSRATRTDFLLETYSGTGYNQSGTKDTINISQNSDGTYDIVPTLDYSNTNIIRLTDPRGWGFNGTQTVVQSGFLNRPDFTDDLKSLRASLNGEFGGGSVIKGWEVGANFSRREKQSRYTSFFLCPKGGGSNCTVASGTPTSAAVPADVLLKDQVSLDYLGVPRMLTYDPLAVYGLLNSVFDNRPGSLVRDNTVTEKVYTGYAKLVIDGTAGGKALRGSIGLQVVHTEQGSTGAIATLRNGVVTSAPVSGETSYTNFLPSATMSLELMDAFYVKLGAAQTMIRPRLDQERITQAVNFDASKIGQGSLPQNSPFSSDGGNFALRPYKSTNIDISVEKYLRGGGYLALTGFYKSFTDFVDPNNNTLYDFSPLLGALPADIRAIIVAQNAQFGLVKTPANTGRGDLLGVEATASIPFTVFSKALDGFGIFASGTYVDSRVIYGSNPTQPITLPGQSKWVATGTAYYEKNGFQARATYRWRDSFLAELAGLSANPEFRTGKAEGVLARSSATSSRAGRSRAWRSWRKRRTSPTSPSSPPRRAISGWCANTSATAAIIISGSPISSEIRLAQPGSNAVSSEQPLRIVVAGGGTAGWMTAAALARFLGPGFSIALVESEEIGTVGVGEATIPQIRLFNAGLGIDENAFMAATQATFKLAIEFVGWTKGGQYMHAFGDIGRDNGLLAFHHTWLRGLAEGVAQPLAAYSLNNVAALANRMQRGSPRTAKVLAEMPYAFHFDAGLYARFLRHFAEARGVVRHEGRILDVHRDGEGGNVVALTLDGDRRVEGDLFVDCTGFRGLLIGGALGVGCEDWTHWLPCDRAIAVPSARAADFTPYTRATAHGAGWQWRIPLQHRTGNGIVYSSAHLSDDEASERLLRGLDAAPLADPRPLRFTTGKRARFWERNVIAVGLASGFMEPLESTSIHMIQSAVERILKLLSGQATQPLRDEYNAQTHREYDRIRDFLILHYRANDRDEPFWRERREASLPDGLAHKIDLWRTSGTIVREGDDLFGEVAWLQVLAGQGIAANAHHPVASQPGREQIAEYLDLLAKLNQREVAQMPDHAAYVAQHCATRGAVAA